jgi:hypothetical protein
MCVHVYVRTYTDELWKLCSMYVCVCVCVCVHVCPRVSTHINMRAHTCALTHTRARTHKCAFTDMHIHRHVGLEHREYIKIKIFPIFLNKKNKNRHVRHEHREHIRQPRCADFQTCVRRPSCGSKEVCFCFFVYTNACMHSYMHTHMHTYIYVHTIRIHTYMYMHGKDGMGG